MMAAPPDPPPTLGAAAAAAVTALASRDIDGLVEIQDSVLFRLRSATASLTDLDTPDSAAAVKTATEEIVRNAALLNTARADLEDVFKRARNLRRRLEAAFPPPPPPPPRPAKAEFETE